MNNMKFSLIITSFVAFVCACIALLTSCSVHVTRTERSPENTVTVSDTLERFEGIDISGSMTVHYAVSETECSFRAVLPTTIAARLQLRVWEGTLHIFSNYEGDGTHISFGDKSLGDAEIWVTGPALTQVRMAGSGDFDCHGVMRTESMEISLAGSGDVDFSSLEVASQCLVRMAGSGDVDIDRLVSPSTHLQVAGSGDIDVHFDAPDGFCKAEVAGSGDIELTGRLGRLEQGVAGSGEIDVTKLTVGK